MSAPKSSLTTGYVSPLTGFTTFFEDIGKVVHVAEDAAKLSLGDYSLIFFGVVLVIMAIASYNKRPVTKVTNVIGARMSRGMTNSSARAAVESSASAPSVAEAALVA